jgi:predicted phosphate transport protein (TIGR00153 family)
MFKFFFKKENRVEELIYKYLENFQLICENFEKAVFSCINEPHCKEFNFLKEQTDKYESKADDIIEEINNLMYGKVLIPDSREDIMRLLHSLDKIPGDLEIVLFIIKYQKLVIPEKFFKDIRDLVKISLESCETLSKQVVGFIKKEKGTRTFMNTIDKHESHCDYIEKRLIQKIFTSTIDPFVKLQLKELILCMGDISDRADKISKMVNILSMKRRV